MSNVIKVLSIDGGGIRGIIPAVILAEIERRSNQPIARLFDLIAGTSTGGILALALVKPDTSGEPEFRAEDLITLYEHEGATIFSRSLVHEVRSIGNILEEKYASDGIEQVLARYFGVARFKDALTETVLTSYEIERHLAFFFKSRRAKLDDAYDFPMTQIARATSAAPTYFQPMQLRGDQASEYYALIDGGVYANNPAMCGYVEARTTHPEADGFLVVSLGTGELTHPLPYDKARNWGLVQWAKPLLNVVFHGVSSTVDYQMRQLLPDRDGLRRYYRFQVKLNPENNSLDRVGRDNLRALKLLAEDLIREQSALVDLLCDQLLD